MFSSRSTPRVLALGRRSDRLLDKALCTDGAEEYLKAVWQKIKVSEDKTCLLDLSSDFDSLPVEVADQLSALLRKAASSDAEAPQVFVIASRRDGKKTILSSWASDVQAQREWLSGTNAQQQHSPATMNRKARRRKASKN